MLLIANALYKWAALLVDKADAGEKESLGSAGTKARSVAGGVVKSFGFTGLPAEGVPPAHWIELVRRHAPEFISFEGSLLENPTGSLEPEHGEAKTEARVADDPPSGIQGGPPRMSPGPLANQPLDFPETKVFSMERGVDNGFGSAERGAPYGGAPAHWVELVRRRAPELLFHEDPVLENSVGPFATEDGEVKAEPESGNDRYLSTRRDADPSRVSPRRLANQALDSSKTKVFSTGGGDNGSGLAEKGVPNGGPPAHWVELVRRQAPELLFHEDSVLKNLTGSFNAENGETRAEEPESANDRSARMDANGQQGHPRKFANRQGKPVTPSAPIFRTSFPTDDSANLSAGSENRAGVNPGRNSHEQESRESTSFVVSEEPLSARRGPPPGRMASPGEPEILFEDQHRRAHPVGPAVNSVQTHEEIPATSFFPSTGIGPASELKRKRPIVADREDRKENPTEKTESKERSDRIPLNPVLDEPFFGSSIPDGRKSNFKAEGQNPFIPARGKVPREEDFQPFNHNRAQDLAWPNLPGEPDRKDPMATFQDRWPALLEEDPDLGNQSLNENRQYYSGKTKVAERIRRLDREQRGLGWNE